MLLRTAAEHLTMIESIAFGALGAALLFLAIVAFGYFMRWLFGVPMLGD